MKKLLLLSTIFLMKFVSAYNGYGRFSLDEFFYRINPETVVFGILFIIFFAFIYYALSKVFRSRHPYERPNVAIPAVISLATSALIIYGIYLSDFRYILSDIAYYSYILNYLIPILIIIFVIYLIWLFERRSRRNRRRRYRD